MPTLSLPPELGDHGVQVQVGEAVGVVGEEHLLVLRRTSRTADSRSPMLACSPVSTKVMFQSSMSLFSSVSSLPPLDSVKSLEIHSS